MITVTMVEYKLWLMSNGMSETQARIIAPMMEQEQMPMSVPVVQGFIKGVLTEPAKKAKYVEIRERWEL